MYCYNHIHCQRVVFVVIELEWHTSIITVEKKKLWSSGIFGCDTSKASVLFLLY